MDDDHRRVYDKRMWFRLESLLCSFWNRNSLNENFDGYGFATDTEDLVCKFDCSFLVIELFLDKVIALPKVNNFSSKGYHYIMKIKEATNFKDLEYLYMKNNQFGKVCTYLSGSNSSSKDCGDDSVRVVFYDYVRLSSAYVVSSNEVGVLEFLSWIFLLRASLVKWLGLLMS